MFAAEILFGLSTFLWHIANFIWLHFPACQAAAAEFPIFTSQYFLYPIMRIFPSFTKQK